MFVRRQPLPYQVMSSNSLKQMETRRDVWRPEAMRNAEKSSSSTDLVLRRRRGLWKVDRVSCERREQLSTGKGQAGVRTEDRRRRPPALTSESSLHRRISDILRSESHGDEADSQDSDEGDTLLQGWTVASHGSGASTEPCKPRSLGWGPACSGAGRPHVLGTTGGAEERKQRCQQTILNSHSALQGSGGRRHVLA